MIKSLLSLVMIVKDEAESIKIVLEAVKPYIDHWTILDTGSKDGTQSVIKETLVDKPGELFEESFVDFATNRNRVMELDVASKNSCVFQLMLSGDEYLQRGEELRFYLETHRDSDIDCHRIRVLIDNTTFFSPRVFRTGSQWKYEGVIHEFPANYSQENAPIADVLEASIEHIVSDPEKRMQNIWDNHIPVLKAILEDNPDDTRALTFLASSYESLFSYMRSGERISYAMETMSLYLRRLALPLVNDAERNFFRMRYLTNARLTGVYTDDEILARCKELHEDDPKRPETAMLLVYTAARLMPPVIIYSLAVQAANVAEEAMSICNSSPVSTMCKWQAHFMAASAAKKISQKYPNKDAGDGRTYEELLRQHISAGIAAGGTWDVFKSVLSNNKAKSDAA